MFWSRRSTESVLAALRAENSDLRAQLRAERAQWEADRISLLDRLLALSAPAALREVRRAPSQEPAAAAIHSSKPRPRHPNYPGRATYLRPPSPPSLPTPGTSPLSDTDRLSVTMQLGDTVTTSPLTTTFPTETT
jgi:hypothetical protein